MKLFLVHCCCNCSCLLIAFAGFANAQPAISTDPISGSQRINQLEAQAGYNSSYIWHGITFQEALTYNPNVTYTYHRFSVNAWFNFPVAFYNKENAEEQRFNELDLNVSYELDKEFSYTQLMHSSQLFTPLSSSNYWGMLGIYQGFYKGSFGVYLNPEFYYYPFSGGIIYEAGLCYSSENKRWNTEISLGYSNSNKEFTVYNICGNDESACDETYAHVKLDILLKYSINTLYLKPQCSIYKPINYTDKLGYNFTYAAGLTLGIELNFNSNRKSSVK